MAAPTIAFVGGGTTKGAGAVTPTWGTVNANDILCAIAETSNLDTWDSDSAFGGTAVTGSPVTQGGTKLWAKWWRAAGGETADTFIDPGDHQIVCVLCVRGCPTSGDPFDAELQLSQLRWVCTSNAGAAGLAENYAGLPIGF
jgi:hypothetical protein